MNLKDELSYEDFKGLYIDILNSDGRHKRNKTWEFLEFYIEEEEIEHIYSKGLFKNTDGVEIFIFKKDGNIIKIISKDDSNIINTISKDRIKDAVITIPRDEYKSGVNLKIILKDDNVIEFDSKNDANESWYSPFRDKLILISKSLIK